MNNDTEDFSDIMRCARGRRMALEILQAWDKNGLPDTFYDDGVKFAFNRNSGNVFLVNSDYQCAMMNGDDLAIFHFTPYEGHEGFIADLLAGNSPDDLHSEDVEYILNAAKAEGATLPDVWAALTEDETS